MKRTEQVVIVGILGLTFCQQKAPPPPYQLMPVSARDVVVSVNANGSIQPKDSVEIKSKASGEITSITVQTGDEVKKGQQLVLVDRRIPLATLRMAQANLVVAQATLKNAQAQRHRMDDLWTTKSVTEQDHDAAVLAEATANAQVIKAKADVDNAQIAYDDTDVRSPKDGVVLTKNVDVGTVIASATGSVSGGTVLLKMANLDTVAVRAMVDETDIGKLNPGLAVTITVDAYPNRTFTGQVLKIEPQSVVQQNVTLFPVTMVLPNADHLLRPGMNTEIAITVGQRLNVITIPNAALRTQRDVASAAGVIGISMDLVNQQLAAAQPRSDSGHASLGNGRGDAARSTTAGGEMYTKQDGSQVKLPTGVTTAQVDALVAKMRAGRGQPRGSSNLTDDEKTLSTQLREAGVFGRPGGNGGGGRGRGRGGNSGDQSGGDTGDQSGGGSDRPMRRNNSYQFGGNYIVFTMRQGKPTAVPIKTGLTNLDFAEVVSGLTANDTVLLLPSASLVASQEQMRQRTAQQAGVPGLKSGTAVPGAGGAPGGRGRGN
ncbi:MAG TPA: efflux RND transporter periplasmic adaptor subunit [Gemmatimonadales bacterium]